MDDKTFIAQYAAQETQRINQRLRDMLVRGEAPSDEEKDAILADIGTTLSRLKSALSAIAVDETEEQKENTTHAN